MAKIYFNKYKKMIDNGELTVAEAIAEAEANVPTKWRNDVVALLEALNT